MPNELIVYHLLFGWDETMRRENRRKKSDVKTGFMGFFFFFLEY